MNEFRKDIHSSSVPVLCQACEARHRGVCGGMEPNELLSLGKSVKIKTYPAGAALSSESETAEIYANILSGVVKLSKMLSDGRQQIVGLQFAPDFLGRLFAEENHVTAEAATDVTVCQFPRDKLHNMMRSSPGLEDRLYKQSLRELDDARDWMLTLGRRSATERVASFLLQIALHADPYQEIDRSSPRSITVPLSRTDIADFLGLTIETVSRQFTKLRQDGVITDVSGREVTIPHIGRLEDIAGS